MPLSVSRLPAPSPDNVKAETPENFHFRPIALRCAKTGGGYLIEEYHLKVLVDPTREKPERRNCESKAQT